MRKSLRLVSALACAGLACGREGDPAAPALPGCPPGNNAPILAAQPDTSAARGDTLFLWARATDPDGDAIRYAALMDLSSREWRGWPFPEAHMDGETGRFWFVTSTDRSASRRFRFIADDGRCGRDTTGFVVRISPPPPAPRASAGRRGSSR